MKYESLPNIVAGDGDSTQTAIRFQPCDRATRAAAEYHYICSRFGVEGVDWDREIHFTRPGLTMISDWNIGLADGSIRSVFFDASVSLDLE